MEREIMLEQSIRFATIEELNQFATEEETLDTLAKQNDTQYVIEAATALQDLLEMALLPKRPRTFAAKIQKAYELKIIDDGLHRDFNAIWKVRNEFAHAPAREFIHLASAKLRPHFQKFSCWTEPSDQRALFDERLKACMRALSSQVDTTISDHAWSDVTP
jgi:hypothetical protein